MKQINSLLILLSLAIALTSCGKKEDASQTSLPKVSESDENVGNVDSNDDEEQLPQNIEMWASLSETKKVNSHIALVDGSKSKELNNPNEELVQNKSDYINDVGSDEGELVKGPFEGPFGMKFVQLPAGSFMMGRIGNQVEETINEPFQIATTEVTQKQYKSVMHALPEELLEIENRAFLLDDKPVVFVSLDEAIIFTKILSALDKDYDYRIPVEKEWEYAARGGTKTEYFCDESSLVNYAIYGRTWGKESAEGPHAVQEKLQNPFQLYDMLGNVSEWCVDLYDTSLSTTRRTIRGGSWLCTSTNICPTTRSGADPEFHSYSIGFRPVRTPKKKKTVL